MNDADAREIGTAHAFASVWDNGPDAVASLRHEMEPDPRSQLYIPPTLIDEVSEPFGNSVHQTRSGL